MGMYKLLAGTYKLLVGMYKLLAVHYQPPDIESGGEHINGDV